MEEDLAKQLEDLEVRENNEDSRGFEQSNLGESSLCNLIVNYLPHHIDDLALKTLFQDFGEIVAFKVVRDKSTKKSLGYGFVKYALENEASLAIEKMNGISMGHKILKVSLARPPSLDIRNCKLYITNLPKEYNEREVYSLFQEFGEIIECRVLKEKDSMGKGVSKGVAFVQFSVRAEAENALSLNGCQLEGSSRSLVVKYAEDQHKKKELSRLQNLTMTAAFRGLPNQQYPQSSQRSPDIRGGSAQGGYYFQSSGVYPRSPASPSAGPSNMPDSRHQYHSSNMINYGAQSYGNKFRKGYSGTAPPMPPSSEGWYGGIPPEQMAYMHSVPPPPQSMVSMDLHPNHNLQYADYQSSYPVHNMHGNMRGMPSPPGFSQNQMMNRGPSLVSDINSPMGGAGLQGASQQYVPAVSSPPGCSLSVNNLPKDPSISMIHELFARFGRVLNIHIEDRPVVENNSFLNYRARVLMQTPAQAEAALQNMNGAVLFDGSPPIQITII